MQGLLDIVEKTALADGVAHGETKDTQPPGLTSTLYPYQSSTVQWMIDSEKRSFGLADGAMFPVPIGARGDRKLWINTFGQVQDRLAIRGPPMTGGGILASEMGLGKTIMSIATILANPRHPANCDQAIPQDVN